MLSLLAFGCGRIAFDPGDCAGFTLADAQVNLSSRLALQPSGATGAVTFTLSGPGVLLADGVTFVSPASRSTTVVTASDAVGCTTTATITTAGNAMFWISGTYNSVPTNEVWRSVDALTWTRIGSLPDARVNAAGAVFHDAFWLIGGSTDGGAIGQSNVWASRDGVSWTDASQFPVALTDAAAIGFTDRLWVIGGHGNPGGVWSTADGTTWQRESTLPSLFHGGELVVLDDRLLYMGGHDDSAYYDTEYASADGRNWTNIGSLPSQREFQSTTMRDGVITIAGGTDSVGNLQDSFTSRDALTWTTGGALPARRTYAALGCFVDRLYLIGGSDGGDVWSSNDTASWTIEATTLPRPRWGGILAQLTPDGGN